MTTTDPNIADTVYQTASVSPTSGRAVYAAVESARSDSTDPGLPTASGCGLAWTRLDSILYDDGSAAAGPGGPVSVATLASDKSGANQITYTLGPFTPTVGTVLGLVIEAVDDVGHIPTIDTVSDNTGRVYDTITVVNATQTDEYKLFFFTARTGNIAGSTTISVTFTEQITGINLVLLEFTGADTGSPVPVGQAVHTYVATAAKPDISLPVAPQASSMVVAAVGTRRNPPNWTPESGWTERYDDANSNPTNGLQVATKSGDQRYTATGTSIEHWLLIVEIQAATVPTTTNNRRRLSVFRGTGTPSAGRISFTFPGVQSHANWHVVESDGAQTPQLYKASQISATDISTTFTPTQSSATVLTFLARSGSVAWAPLGATQLAQAANTATPSTTMSEYSTLSSPSVIGGTSNEVQNLGMMALELAVVTAPVQTPKTVPVTTTIAAALSALKLTATQKAIAATTTIGVNITMAPRFAPKQAVVTTLTATVGLTAVKHTPVQTPKTVATTMTMGASVVAAKRFAGNFISGPVTYRVVLATRGTTALGTPIISDVFAAAGVSYTDEHVGRWSRVLNGAGSFEFTLPIDSCTPDVYAPGEREIHVYRTKAGLEQLAWAGTLMVADVRAPWVRFLAMGWYESLRHREMGDDFFHKDTEQLDIAWNLINYTQSQPDGNLGIVRESIAGSGTNRTIDACAEERSNIADMIEDLAAADDGFDFEITPDKVWHTWIPTRGVDRTAEVVLNAQTDILDFAYTIDATTVENEVAGIGKQGNCEPIHYVRQVDAISRARYGLMQGTISRSDLDDTDLITALASEELGLRSVARRQPTVQLTQALGGASIFAGNFDLGDSISISASWGYATFNDQFRVLGYLVSFDRMGNEFVELTVEAVSA